MHFDTQNAPAPGPCRNDRLLVWDCIESKYVGRFGLFMAVKDRAGDYRRVSKATWDEFRSFYPGSGPTISIKFNTSEVNESGLYDTSLWNILDPPPPPQNKDKKKKKKLFDRKNKSDKENEQPAGRGSNETKPTNEVSINENQSYEFASIGLNKKSSTDAKSSTTKYEVLLKERGSHTSGDGLLGEDPDHVRSSSVVGADPRDSVR